MKSLSLYLAAAVAEIAGCFAVWYVVRHAASTLWLAPATACLALFAWLLTRVDVAFAGRAYAAYGGIYIAASLVWLFAIEGKTPDRWDLIGAGICCLGAMIILFMPHANT